MKPVFCNDFTLGAYLRGKGFSLQRRSVNEKVFNIVMAKFVPVAHKKYLESCGIKFLFSDGLAKKLLGEGIYNLADLIQKSEDDLLAIPRLGKKTVERVKGYLAEKTLSLNMLFVAFEGLKYYKLLEAAKPEWFFSKREELKWVKLYFSQAKTLKDLFELEEHNKRLRITRETSIIGGRVIRKLVSTVLIEYNGAVLEKNYSD